jgi:hypothetical protein
LAQKSFLQFQHGLIGRTIFMVHAGQVQNAMNDEAAQFFIFRDFELGGVAPKCWNTYDDIPGNIDIFTLFYRSNSPSENESTSVGESMCL